MNITWRKTPHEGPQWRSHENIADDNGARGAQLLQALTERHQSARLEILRQHSG